LVTYLAEQLEESVVVHELVKDFGIRDFLTALGANHIPSVPQSDSPVAA
jgi:hypothetical protein